MSYTSTRDPDIIKKTSGGGCLTLFGLPFFLVGLFIIGVGFGFFPAEERPPVYIAVPFGGIFASVGLVLIAGRAGITINRRRKTATKWYGLMVPMKRTEYMLEYYDRVTLKKETRSGNKSNYTVYPVRLESNADMQAIVFEEQQDYQSARKAAEDLAEFLSIRLEDTSSGRRVVRESDKLDESVRERAIRTGEQTRIIQAPPDLRADVIEEPGKVVIDIHPPGFNKANYIGMGFSLVFAALVLTFFIRPLLEMPMPDEFRIIAVAVIGFIFVLLPILSTYRKYLGQARKTQRIEATSAALIVTETVLGKTRVTEIPVDELEDLDASAGFKSPPIKSIGGGKYRIGADEDDMEEYPSYSGASYSRGRAGSGAPKEMIVGRRTASVLSALSSSFGMPGGIIARSDKVTAKFGKGLRQDEIEYILAKIKDVITR